MPIEMKIKPAWLHIFKVRNAKVQAKLSSTSQDKEISLSFYTLSARKTYKH